MGRSVMRKVLLGMALTLPIAFLSSASAMPAGYPLLRDAAAENLGLTFPSVGMNQLVWRLSDAVALQSAESTRHLIKKRVPKSAMPNSRERRRDDLH